MSDGVDLEFGRGSFNESVARDVRGCQDQVRLSSTDFLFLSPSRQQCIGFVDNKIHELLLVLRIEMHLTMQAGQMLAKLTEAQIPRQCSWAHFGPTLVSLWGQLRITLRSLWGHNVITLVFPWGHFRIVFGATLGSLPISGVEMGRWPRRSIS